MVETTLRGRYEIIRKLGKGGFSETYLAQDKDLPGNPLCVVKQFKPQSSNPLILQTARRLFDREAQVLYRLGIHDQIPRLLAHIEENDQFYLVQDFIEGDVLSKELALNGQWDEDKVIAFLHDILKILEFVHQQGVIHRDIKPSNIIRRISDGKLVLIDFGAVKEISSLGSDGQGITVIGTPGYMPVEQNVANPQFNSDIYALGMTAIQFLTGVLPERLPKHPVTNEFDWQNLANVRPQVATILGKMIRSDFRHRYQSTDEVLQALSSLTKIAQRWSTTKIALFGVLLLTTLFFITVIAIPSIKPIFNLPIDKPLIENFLLYQNSKYGISIKYPKTWKVEEIESIVTGDVAKFYLPPKESTDSLPPQVTVEIQNLKYATSLQDFSKQKINEIRQFLPDAKINEQRLTTLANLPAEKVVYTGEDDPYTVKRMAVWTLKDNKAYIITYTVEESQYDDFVNTAKVMIDSLQIN